MILRTNKVKAAYRTGKPCFGLYVSTPSTRMVEMMAGAGFDFVRIDMEGGLLNIETVTEMIRTAHACDITPFVRVQGPDEWQIQAVLKAGALGIIIPKVTGPADILEAVRAAKLAPHGERHAGPGLPTGGFGKVSAAEYDAWVREEIILSAQIETKSGVDSIDEIVQIPGLDMVQSGRGDLSYSYGVDGQYHEVVLAAESRVIEAGMKAGKMTSVQYYPVPNPSHIERIQKFIQRGVLCISCGSDTDLVAPFRSMLAQVKG